MVGSSLTDGWLLHADEDERQAASDMLWQHFIKTLLAK
jgi:hypothetical protein